jgi:hypothetical protein
MSIAQLRAHLETQGLEPRAVVSLLATCWNDLAVTDRTNMRPDKLSRIEQPTWNPPFLEFSIERHGQTVNGSTRATVYRWKADLEKGTAKIIDEKPRQLYAMDARLNLKSIVESLAEAIIKGNGDPRIAIGKDGTVRLKVGEIVPATNAWTTSDRRKRLRKHLSEMLSPHGWTEIRTNVYGKKPTA